MIDLHTHTDESDGSYSPARLVAEAKAIGLEALGICDHDNMAGYDLAVPIAREAGLELVCGIELSTKYRGKSVHLLGYFLHQPPAPEFRSWLGQMQDSRRDRNRRMVERLRGFGMEITIAEVEARGRRQAGRPHFAALLVEKGYAATVQQAFDEYLDEAARGYVQRLEPTLEEAIGRILKAGGLPSLAHPVRLLNSHRASLDAMLREFCDMGLKALEVYHYDHSPAQADEFRVLADRYGLAVTGGSDFHGDTKPSVRLGWSQQGTQRIPREVLDRLR
ncbi:MAG: PHP domain-containing protein [Bryobacterales bacterium]|nr:PHP domain-containing protein [Bryobacterales bacterium]